jgi:diguanylate cyclase (GGDEF)-like protein
MAMEVPVLSAFFAGILPSGSLQGTLADNPDPLFASASINPVLLITVAALLCCGAVWGAYRILRTVSERRLQRMLSRQQAAIEHYQREQLRLQLQSAHDSLTGAFGRATILEMLKVEAERSRRLNHRFSALLITIDQTRTLQQHYGVDAMNAVLRDAVKQCRAHVRSFDLIGRFSADEFIVLLAEADRATVEGIAQRLHRSVAQTPLHFEGLPIGYTISIAHHSLSAAHSCPVTLLERCQNALKQARNSGNSQVAAA